MTAAELPHDEAERLRELARLELLEGPAEPALDRMTRLASRLFDTPIALITLIDETRQCFKSRVGTDLDGTPRELAFCTHAIRHPSELMVVEDARLDPRFADNPLVTGEPGIRFYAGYPIRVERGPALGTLCIVDTRPRQLDEGALAQLADLGRTVESLLEARLHEREYRRVMRRHEAHLNELNAILETAAAGIVRIDHRGIVQSLNPSAQRLFGYRREEVIGRNVSMLMPRRWADHHDDYLANYQRSGQRKIIGIGREVQGLRKDGSVFPMHLSVSELKTQDTPQYIGIISDITELHEAMEEANRANQAKSEFLSSMSHELRTPLNAILGFAQLMLNSRRETLNLRQRDRIEHIYKSGQHLLELVNDVLDLARIEAGRLTLSIEAVDLRDLIGEALALIRPMADARHIRLRDDSDRLPRGQVWADFTRGKQVLLNLLSNAVKYNREAGEVSLAVLPPGRHQGPAADASWMIRVRDDGPGIAPELQDALFQPFNRLGREDGAIEGTGIGLVITRQLVEQMGGQVGVESRPGEGSTFWFTLPEARADNAVTSVSAVAATDAGETVRTVLYIEDNPANLTLIEQVMDEIGGIRLISAVNASLGLQMARSRRPDLIILDINLPGTNGYRVARQLKQWSETRAIPIIALSANATDRAVREGEQNPDIMRYLTKPLRLDQLQEAMSAAFAAPDAGDAP